MKVKENVLIKLIKQLFQSAPLPVKIMGIVSVFISLLGLIVIVDIRANMTSILTDELQKRAITISNEVASESTNPLLVGDIYSLYENARNVAAHNDDVRYVLIFDEYGQWVANTFGQGIPKGLLELRELAQGNPGADVMEIASEEGVLLDAVAPIAEGKVGWVRIGMSESSMNKSINALSTKLMMTTLGITVLGLLGAFIMSHLLTRPINRLVDASLAVSEGDFSQRVSAEGKDEIGQLSRTFNGMAASLEQYTMEREAILAELLEKEEIRKELLNKVITAQEEERKRISRELHDEASQSLTSLIIGLKLLGTGTDLKENRKMAEELREVASLTLEEVHRLAVELRPTVLDDMGLIPALERYVAEYRHQHEGRVVDLQVQNQLEERLPAETETTLYRIVQEALTNIAKYSQARNVSIVLELKPDLVHLIVEDDGVGFNPEPMKQDGLFGRKHLGIAGMKERTTLLGGSFEIESEPDHGTTIYVRLPLKWRGYHERENPITLG